MARDPTRFLRMFVDASRDNLAQLNAAALALADDPESVHAAFRAAHTIKGSARMLNLTTVSETAHGLEDVLSGLRDGRLGFDPALAALLQRGVDALSILVEHVAEGRPLPAVDETLRAAFAAASEGTAPESASVPAPAPIAEAAPIRRGDADPGPAAADGRLKAPDSVRVRVERLDGLVRLMGEVAASHLRLRHVLGEVEESRQGDGLVGVLRDELTAQGLLMRELNDAALSMRMLPLSWVFEPSARLARELGRTMGKAVECSVSGADVELDRQIIERLGDPLVHLIRNAIDHGIDAPEERLARGKPIAGQIRLASRQEGGAVVIEVGDDGGGLPLDKIRAKAVQKGYVDADRAEALSEAQVCDLIFLPGFSTSAILTEVSGRGVGMDVVKKTIVDELQGSIGIETRPSQGTTLRLRLPMSLAVMRIVLCAVGGLQVGFAATHVSQITRVRPEDELRLSGRMAFVLDNEFVPLVGLAQLLGRPPSQQLEAAGHLVVVVDGGQGKIGLVVDDIVDEGDMVIKPLPAHVKCQHLVGGMVVTGKSELVSILHVPRLAELARRVQGDAVAPPRDAAAGKRDLRILVVDDSLSTREIEKDVLEAHGYRVTLAEDGIDGWQKAASGDFDAVLTDVEMPGLDGFSLTAKLRGSERHRHTPIIIITSRESEADKRRGIEVGADAYIVKGDFNQTSLVDALRNLLA